jgi:hypothetical protein
LKDLIEAIVEIVNILHDLFMDIFLIIGFTLTDKELHFWVIGIIGMFLFAFTQILFKLISKWSITAISFTYTFTVLIVIVFAIEIEQKITGKGNMEFSDILAGIYGFIAFFLFYLVIRFVNYIMGYLMEKKKK